MSFQRNKTWVAALALAASAGTAVTALAGGGTVEAAPVERRAPEDRGAGHRVEFEASDAIPLPLPRVIAPGAKGDTVLSPAAGNPFTLDFAAGTYAPPAVEVVDANLGSAFQQLGHDARPLPQVYGFLMLQQRLTAARRAELAALGVRELGMHPHYAMKVAFPPEAVPALAAHAAVRWIGVARTWQKMHPHLAGVVAAHVGPAPLRVVITTFESDLCAASTSVAAGSPLLLDPGMAPVPGPEAVAGGRRWTSNGWQQRALEALGVAVEEYQPRSLCFRAALDPAVLLDVLQLDFVHFVEAVVIDSADHEESIPMIHGDSTRVLWSGNASQDAFAGIIDSGVNTGHEALNHIWGVSWDNSTNGTGATNDLCAHGSHVAGTILGKPPASSDEFTGLAPDLATWQGGRFRHVKYLDLTTGGLCQGTASHSTLYGHMEGSYSDGSFISEQPEVVNCSWGNTASAWFGTEANAVTLDNEVWDYDQVYVFSAGNAGPGASTIGLPAVAKNALTVGSVITFQEAGVGEPGTLASSSSIGPCADGRWKPNLVAPGRTVTSVNGATTSGYVGKSGTSMAAPHVTGVVAQLVDHIDYLRGRPHRTMSLLQASAVTKGDAALTSPLDAHLDTYGCGRVSAFKAHYVDSDWDAVNWGFTADASSYHYDDFEVESGAERLVVCMTYLEAAASTGAAKALVNDFDLWIDKPAVDTGAGDTGEYSAQQSTLNNTEIRIIDDPDAGTWRWKVFPDNVTSSARVSISVYVISGDTTPVATLDLDADDTFVKPDEAVTVLASVTASDYLASNVFLDTSVTSAPAFTGAEVVLADGIVADLTGNQQGGQDVLLGEIQDSESRAVEWTVNWATEGVKTFAVSMRSDNAGDAGEEVTVTVDGTDPTLPTNLGSSSHVLNGWTSDTSATLTWNAATDALSGVDGYSLLVNNGSAAAPDLTKDIGNVTQTVATLANSTTGYYFSLKTVDKCGNWSNSFASKGPYFVDAQKPGLAGSLASPTHTAGTWSTSSALTVTWTPANDAHSGLSGYATSITSGAPALPNPVQNLGTVTSQSFSAGPSAQPRYFNIRSRDVAGNWDNVAASFGPILIDSIAPSAPGSLGSSTHVPGVWSPNASVTVSFTASNDSHSGLAGYDVDWDHAAGTIPDGPVDTSPLATSSTLPLAADASGWYFHVRPRDVAGNWGPTAHFGPILIDGVAPNGPTAMTSPTHLAGALSTNGTVTVHWTAALDGASGLAGYDGEWDHAPATIPAGALDLGPELTSHVQSLPIAAEGWYFHLRARDVAGNWGATAHFGPVFIGLCSNYASHANYGTGKPGAFGVPLLVAPVEPVLGEAAVIEIQNGRPGALPTLYIGLSPAALPFDGGVLLVNPLTITALPVPIPASGVLTLPGPLPADPLLCGATIYCQVSFTDPGAAGSYHQALTGGLSLTFGS